MDIDLSDPQLEHSLLEQERLYSRLREMGEEAPARILSLTDTGLRIGNDASLFEFYVEVFPDELPSFNATTRQTVSDDSLAKFETGHTIFVKYDPKNPKLVAMELVPVESPEKVIVCPSCGASQTHMEGQTACDYCKRPFGI